MSEFDLDMLISEAAAFTYESIFIEGGLALLTLLFKGSVEWRPLSRAAL